jgi:hypothetical protein
MRPKYPNSDPTSIGRLLQDLGLKRSQLNAAVAHQKLHPRSRLGEICIHLGFMPPERVEMAIRQQRAKRRGDVNGLIDMATRCTKRMTKSAEGLVVAGADALSKLKTHDTDN